MKPLLKWHGGKFYLHQWIINHFPNDYQNLIYVELAIGGGSILLNKQQSIKEIINDKNPKLINVYNILINHTKEFINQLSHTKYNEETFENTLEDSDNVFNDNIDHAVNYYILSRMSRGGMGKNFAWSERFRGNQFGDVNAWENSIKNLENIKNRIKNVELLNKDFRVILNDYNDLNTFLYIDLPYLQSTRTSKEVYEYEMSKKDHKDLLELITQSKTKILISGYNSNIYNMYLDSWQRSEKLIVNHSGQGISKNFRKECLWRNYEK